MEWIFPVFSMGGHYIYIVFFENELILYRLFYGLFFCLSKYYKYLFYYTFLNSSTVFIWLPWFIYPVLYLQVLVLSSFFFLNYQGSYYLFLLIKKFFCMTRAIIDWLIDWPHRAACRILVPRPGIELRPRQWKRWVLTTGPPGNSQTIFYFEITSLFL